MMFNGFVPSNLMIPVHTGNTWLAAMNAEQPYAVFDSNACTRSVQITICAASVKQCR